MQPHGGGARAAVVEEGDGTRGEIFYVAARVRNGVEEAGWIALVVLEKSGTGGGFVRNDLVADFYGVVGNGRFFLRGRGVALVWSLGFWRACGAFGRLRREARYLSPAQEKYRGKNPETLFHCVVPHLLNWIVLHPLNPAGLYVGAAAESKDRGAKRVDSRQLKVEGSMQDRHGVPCPYGMGTEHHEEYRAQPGLAVPPWNGDERWQS